MKSTLNVYRILATLTVILLASLIPTGRWLEREVQSLLRADLIPVRLIAVVVACVVLGLALRRVVVGRDYRMLAGAVFLGLVLMGCSLLLQSPSEWVHIGLYGQLGFFLAKAADAKTSARPRTLLADIRKWVISIGLGSCIGVADELLQGSQPDRVADPHDVLLNGIGLVLGTCFAAAGIRDVPPRLDTEISVQDPSA